MFLAPRMRTVLRIEKLMMHDRVGRTPREEEDPEGPRQEENNLYSAVRECHHDWRKEKGICSCPFPRSLEVIRTYGHSNDSPRSNMLI